MLGLTQCCVLFNTGYFQHSVIRCWVIQHLIIPRSVIQCSVIWRSVFWRSVGETLDILSWLSFPCWSAPAVLSYCPVLTLLGCPHMAVFCPLHPNWRSCFSYPSPIYCGNRPSRHTILRGKEGAGLVMYDVYWLPMQLVTGFPVTVHSNQMILMIVRRESWTAWAVVKGNSRGAIGLEFTQIRWFSRWPGREAGPRQRWRQKHSKLR